ncbi:MAG: diadenylate cyclase CdaA [Clostridiales bacterium]|nr:diadenylate cyclase CdaA [Clostridiales bacterium]
MQSFMQGLPAIVYPINILDILIIAFVIYKIIDMISGTRAEQLAKGILILIAFSAFSELIGLSTINWVLVQVQRMLIVAIPVIFAPEMRRALEKLGKGKVWRRRRVSEAEDAVTRRIDRIMGCLQASAGTKTGVLIVIARESRLEEYTATGIQLDALVSTALLNNIFVINTPLHDGAVIIDGDRIVAASCYLPLSDNRNISKALGTRHRAGIGLTEVSDAVVCIVSEETGSISIACDGKLSYDLSFKETNQFLQEALVQHEGQLPFWKKWQVFQ